VIFVLILLTIACKSLSSNAPLQPPSINLPILNGNTSTVTRNPREWLPKPNQFPFFEEMPLEETWETNNRQEAEGREFSNELLEMFKQTSRISSAGYSWRAACESSSEITGGAIRFHLYEAEDGATNFFNYYKNNYLPKTSFLRFIKDRDLTPIKDVGDDAFSYILLLPETSCPDSGGFSGAIFFREHNVIAYASISTFGAISEEQMIKKIIKLSKYMEEVIDTEASQNFERPDESDSLLDKDPRDFLVGEINCYHNGESYEVSGSLQNKSDRAITLDVNLNIFQDGSLFSGANDTVVLPPKETTSFSFQGGYLPPDPRLQAPLDNPDTPEYEPEEWIEANGGLHEYSCSVESTPEWDK